MTETMRGPNPEQRSVIEHGDGPIRITAGAGTGKTYTLTQRILRLIEDGQARPDQILALTFTDKAAEEIRERVTEACADLGLADADPVTLITYHSFGYSVLREWGGLIGLPPGPALLSKADAWLLLWDCLPRIDFRHISLLHLRGTYGSPLKSILDLGSRLKDELSSPRALLDHLQGAPDEDADLRHTLEDFCRALLVYESDKRAEGSLDFGDQIALAVEALERPEVRAAFRDRYRHVLVDEYQDTNFAQSVMVGLLTQDLPSRNLCVVGDVRQAIYRFRGAAPDNLERFPSDFPGTAAYSLQTNYRSTEQILAVANTVWKGTGDEFRLRSHDGRQGAPVVSCCCEDEETEWEWIARRIREHHAAGTPYREMAVLVRKNTLKKAVWAGLTARGIPAVMTGGSDLYRTLEVREIISYLRALSRPGDNVSLAHIASSDSFGLDEAALYDILGPIPRGRSLFDVMLERAADVDAPADLRLFLATFQSLLADAATLSPARVVERIVGLRRGAYTSLQQANVYRFHLVAESFSAERPFSATVSSFVAYLSLLLAAPSDEEEATELTEDDAVHIFTVHAAKGLERDVIFVAGASQSDFHLRFNADVVPPALRHPAAGMPVREDFRDEARYRKALTAWEKEQFELEERRIVYVALTRARHRLFISWHRLPTWYGKERRPLEVLKKGLELTSQEQFDRADWEEETAIEREAVDPLDAAKKFMRLQTRLWSRWVADDFDGEDAAGRIAEAWSAYTQEEGLPPAGLDILRGMRHWMEERRHLEGLLSRCLTPAPRPADAARRPVVDVPSTLSYTMLETYRDCSRKAYLRFLAGFPGEPRPWTTGPGKAFHGAVETAALAQREGQPLDFEALIAEYQEHAAEAHGTEMHRMSEAELDMLRRFRESPEWTAMPLQVEAEFYWRVGPGYMHGFIDRIQRLPDGTVELVDFKTGGKVPAEAEARENLQLSIYALAAREVFNVPLDRVTLVYPRLSARVSVTFSQDELTEARRRIVTLMEAARTASYEEVNTAHCPWCDYRLICPAAGAIASSPSLPHLPS